MEKMLIERLNHIADSVSVIGADVASIKAHQEEMKATLSGVKEQTTKTNGKVTSLEGFRIKIIAYATAAGAVFSYVGHVISA